MSPLAVADIAAASFIVTILVLIVRLSFLMGTQSEKIKNLEDSRIEFRVIFNDTMRSLRDGFAERMDKLEKKLDHFVMR